MPKSVKTLYSRDGGKPREKASDLAFAASLTPRTADWTTTLNAFVESENQNDEIVNPQSSFAGPSHGHGHGDGDGHGHGDGHWHGHGHHDN